MSENWKLQLSIKVNGPHMLNIRAETAEEFKTLLGGCVDMAEAIELAYERLQGDMTPQVSAPAPAPAGRPTWRPRATSQAAVPLGETGPVQIVGVGIETTSRDGLPLNNPKHVVRFSDGKTLSTFDASIGQAASTLQGQNVYYRSEQRGKWTNLAGVRRAG